MLGDLELEGVPDKDSEITFSPITVNLPNDLVGLKGLLRSDPLGC